MRVETSLVLFRNITRPKAGGLRRRSLYCLFDDWSLVLGQVHRRLVRVAALSIVAGLDSLLELLVVGDWREGIEEIERWAGLMVG